MKLVLDCLLHQFPVHYLIPCDEFHLHLVEEKAKMELLRRFHFRYAHQVVAPDRVQLLPYHHLPVLLQQLF